MRLPRPGKKSLFFLVILTLAAWCGWRQYPSLLAWYYVHRLSLAEAADREGWINRIVPLEEEGVPHILAELQQNKPFACASLGQALTALLQHWGRDAEPTRALVEESYRRFPLLSTPGQRTVLEVLAGLLAPRPEDSVPAAYLLQAAHQFIEIAHQESVRKEAVALGQALLRCAPKGPWVDTCRALLLRCWSDPELEHRILAVQWSLQAPFKDDAQVLTKMTALLKDPQAPVRRAAILVLGGRNDLVQEDDLLPLLHDSDAEVRRICEVALRSRGLLDHHIALARLITDEQPQARLAIFEELQKAEDLDPGVWLERLSQDPAPAVRAAALRAACTVFRVNLRPRLEQMAQQDPSPTVRQLAIHYLKQNADTNP